MKILETANSSQASVDYLAVSYWEMLELWFPTWFALGFAAWFSHEAVSKGLLTPKHGALSYLLKAS